MIVLKWRVTTLYSQQLVIHYAMCSCAKCSVHLLHFAPYKQYKKLGFLALQNAHTIKYITLHRITIQLNRW